MRCLTSLGIRIPLDLRLSCIDVKQKYPVAVKLKEALSIFNRTRADVEKFKANVKKGSMLEELHKLVDDYKFECQKELTNGVSYRWENNEKQLNKYVAAISKACIRFQDKTQKCHDLCLKADKIINDLRDCNLNQEYMNEQMDKLQEIVSKLDDGAYHDVAAWTDHLNSLLENLLAGRIDEILEGWQKTLQNDWIVGDADEDPNAEINPYQREKPLLHTIRVSAQHVSVFV